MAFKKNYVGSCEGLFTAAAGVSVVLRNRGAYKQVPAYVRDGLAGDGQSRQKLLARRLYVQIGGNFISCGADSTSAPQWLVDDVIVEPDSEWQDCVIGDLNRLFLQRRVTEPELNDPVARAV